MLLSASMRAQLRPRPITQYAVALFFVLVAALSMLAALVFHDTAQLKRQIAESDEKLARQELSEAIVLLTRQAESTAQALAQWDEARQQLENPIYYAYWRNSRALASGVLPETLDAVDLYDARGRNLSVTTKGEATMPVQLSRRDMQPFLMRQNAHDHVYFFYPFYQDEARTHLIGYAGIKSDLLRELLQLRKFRYLDLGSVSLKAREGERIPLQDIVPYMQFRTVPNPETHALEKIIARSLYESAFILAVISLLGYLSLVSIVAKPLRRLSDHIEAMGRGKKEQLGESYRGILAVSELENVRQSL